jgi:hypothetical protein
VEDEEDDDEEDDDEEEGEGSLRLDMVEACQTVFISAWMMVNLRFSDL